jgi:hypothetical protein
MLKSALLASVLALVASSAIATPANAGRLFCYNRVTGQFVNWGHCPPVRVVCNYYGPGGYCRRAVPYVVWR